MIPNQRKKMVVMGVATALFIFVAFFSLPVQFSRFGQIASVLGNTLFAQIVDQKKDEVTSQLQQVRLRASAAFGAVATTTLFVASSTPDRGDAK